MKPIRAQFPTCFLIQTIAIAILAFQFAIPKGQAETKPKLILDSDTANEIDDLYAIVRALRQDTFEVLGLGSEQWFHFPGNTNSVQASQKLNQDLVRLLGREDLPTSIGAEGPMGKPWGGDEPRDSPAAQFIIKSALSIPEGEKLNVACTGAATNLASAIKLKPEIAPKIRAYLMGFKYEPKTGVWNKSEFNVRRDLNAADFLLNQKDLELHIMTADVSGTLKFDRDDSFKRQAEMGELGEFLTQRWKAMFPDAKKWIMWDVAVIEAIIHPELAEEEEVMTPPENVQRKVWVYHSIDVERMREDFWKTVPLDLRTASRR
jgi:inosine-uridine nucleoside N-ribohydrolase